MWHALKSSNWNILTPHDAHHCRSPGPYFSLVFCLWFSLRLRRCNKNYTNPETCRRHPAMFHLVSELRSEFWLLLDSGWIDCLIKSILMRIKRNTIQCRKPSFFVSSRKKDLMEENKFSLISQTEFLVVFANWDKWEARSADCVMTESDGWKVFLII